MISNRMDIELLFLDSILGGTFASLDDACLSVTSLLALLEHLNFLGNLSNKNLAFRKADYKEFPLRRLMSFKGIIVCNCSKK